MRILVVEDEKRIADFLGRGLQGAGYAVDVAQDGATALQFTHDTDYDLVILDLMLPDMDGLKVLERIRSRRTPRTGFRRWRPGGAGQGRSDWVGQCRDWWRPRRQTTSIPMAWAGPELW